MKKNLVKWIILFTCFVICLTGCQDQVQEEQESVTVDLDSMIEALLSSDIFDTELELVDDSIAENLIPIGSGEQLEVYMGSGIYADEIVTVVVKDEQEIDDIIAVIDNHINDLRHSFEDYLPEEVSKIDSVVKVQQGCYVAVCISNDATKAKEIMDTYFAGGTVELDALVDSENLQEVEEVSTAPSTSSEVSEMELPVIEATGEIKDYGGVISIGNTAYELYYYVEEDVQSYINSVNKLADELDGVANFYDMVIPTSVSITLPDNYYDQIPADNQEDTINKVESGLHDGVTSINIYDILMQHRNEYLYFRTDHHWTALGAYYAYTRYCDVLGLQPISLEQHEMVQFDGFLGTFYNDTEKSELLSSTPDYVQAYYPISQDVSLTFTDKDGNQISWPVISDVSNASAGSKYITFIAGDNPYTIIKNATLTDDLSCLVIKESFGNAFVPFLIDHYATVHVIDYRYWTGNLVEFVEQNGVQDVLLCNNMSALQSGYLMGKLAQVINGFVK